MDIIKYGLNFNKKCVMCLGYFDSIHKGHIEIIKKAKEYSNLNNILLGVIIFTGGKNNSLDVFSLEERLIKLKSLNVDFVVYNEFTTIID